MDDDDEKDQFYGCGCQRYLALGILLPVILLVSALGVIGFAVLLLVRRILPKCGWMRDCSTWTYNNMVLLLPNALRWAA